MSDEIGDGGQPAPDHDEDAPADVLADEAADLTNGDLARVFHEIGDILEVKGELAFKTIAYHRAADAIGRSPIDLVAAYRAGTAPKVPGVGQAIADKITELVRTGRMAYLEKLREEVPASLVEILRIPGLGPKNVKRFHDELGVLTLGDLETAARGGRVREMRGLSERTEQLILEGIERLRSRPTRMLLHRAEEHIEAMIGALVTTPGVISIEPAGSFRRRKETIGDIDLLAETTDPGALMDRFTGLGIVDAVIGKGGHKSAVRLLRGPQVDLMVMPPGAAGTHLIHFTGSKEHNVRLRARARDKGWSLSEYGFQRIDDAGDVVTGADAELRTFATEGEAYAFLDLPFIEPEMR
jgi:DNA polymerase (family 10)